MPAVDAPLSMSERDLRAAVRDYTRLKHANAALEQEIREMRAKYADLEQKYNEVARERDELRARVAEEVLRERGGMGGWIHERGGVVDHQYLIKSGAKRVGVKLHEEEGILHISQAQEVWADRTATPDRHKLLSEGIYEHITNRRPNKWRHLYTAKELRSAIPLASEPKTPERRPPAMASDLQQQRDEHLAKSQHKY
ncbi:unnamed protein product [Vitrella brassicaformis CCMP3155]|uniref:Uncharacterized protein n=1 Tax=Vitrella brassicaformis (strain CCMP3155) TaxID=1169540 RepID=A0A0G4G6G1_VITBC|nr:unnamed protein product [Vitrella brassicaformis CCMP3155]|eukprot:CEM24117.1 unnamed protein product [Vitrella brassicaformis CCMP3155]